MLNYRLTKLTKFIREKKLETEIKFAFKKNEKANRFTCYEVSSFHQIFTNAGFETAVYL